MKMLKLPCIILLSFAIIGCEGTQQSPNKEESLQIMDFSSVGIHFPLFEGPIVEASEYAGHHQCFACDLEQEHTYYLGIGADLVLACPKCGTETPLDADDKVPGVCKSCNSTVPFPESALGETHVCYSCLRSGRAALTKDTVFGMIAWDQTQSGISHGVPGLHTDMYETVDVGDGWIGARIPVEDMLELLRTPAYSTIQGERWEFHCRKPMIYVGSWSREEFRKRSPDGDGKRFFHSIVSDPVPGLWEDQLHDITGVYVFRCSVCGKLLAHWDIA